MTFSDFHTNIHLLYVPTLSCNLACNYCYLGSRTTGHSLRQDAGKAAATLKAALHSFLTAGVLPFNVSLHGGEPSLLPPQVLAELFTIIKNHYLRHFDALTARGFRKSAPHIKTNLFNFHKIFSLFDQHKVSVSASIDLPLALHDRYRTTRTGRAWSRQTRANLQLLARYPHSKKISSTLYREHLENIDEIIADIWKLHREIGFDMNNYNFMFGFDSRSDLGDPKAGMPLALHAVPEEMQVAFYQAMQAEFLGTELEEGLRRHWFDEFMPAYCTNSFNCGERFYLLQGDGSVYSCVRGQGLEECYFGNILHDPVADILSSGSRRMATLHQHAGLHDDCRGCAYLYLCHTGCPVVKMHHKNKKSYTCALQKALYRDNPLSCPPAPSVAAQKADSLQYQLGMHPALAEEEVVNSVHKPQGVVIPNDLYEAKNAICQIIAGDSVLQQLYADDAVVLEIDAAMHPLHSQILKPVRTLFSLNGKERVIVHMRRSLFLANAPEPVRNSLHLQMLRDTVVIYGDEKRAKQEHLFTHQIFFNHLSDSSFGEEFIMSDLTGLLKLHSRFFRKGVLNNLFITASSLREYHYQKQRNNAFYHIQAINLPFHNFEFYWDGE